MAHFHIDAFGDNIDVNHYENKLLLKEEDQEGEAMEPLVSNSHSKMDVNSNKTRRSMTPK